jgi:hypothetical protein
MFVKVRGGKICDAKISTWYRAIFQSTYQMGVNKIA